MKRYIAWFGLCVLAQVGCAANSSQQEPSADKVVDSIVETSDAEGGEVEGGGTGVAEGPGAAPIVASQARIAPQARGALTLGVSPREQMAAVVAFELLKYLGSGSGLSLGTDLSLVEGDPVTLTAAGTKRLRQAVRAAGERVVVADHIVELLAAVQRADAGQQALFQLATVLSGVDGLAVLRMGAGYSGFRKLTKVSLLHELLAVGCVPGATSEVCASGQIPSEITSVLENAFQWTVLDSSLLQSTRVALLNRFVRVEGVTVEDAVVPLDFQQVINSGELPESSLESLYGSDWPDRVRLIAVQRDFHQVETCPGELAETARCTTGTLWDPPAEDLAVDRGEQPGDECNVDPLPSYLIEYCAQQVTGDGRSVDGQIHYHVMHEAGEFAVPARHCEPCVRESEVRELGLPPAVPSGLLVKRKKMYRCSLDLDECQDSESTECQELLGQCDTP